jgi:hypothetical protein
LEIEVRSIQTVHPAACKFANSEGDYPVRFIDYLGDVQDYTLAGFYWQGKGDGKRADLQSAWFNRLCTELYIRVCRKDGT